MRRVAVPALVVVLAAAAGCGGSDDPAPAPSPTASGSTPASEGSSPGGDAATGLRLDRPNSSVVVPEGWVKGRKQSSDAESADSPDHLAYVTLSEIEAFGSTADAEELGRTRVRSSIDPKPPKLMPVTELDGRPAYHVAGYVTDEQYIEEYGAISNDRIVSLLFAFNKRVPEQDRQDVIDQVLPTFRWK